VHPLAVVIDEIGEHQRDGAAQVNDQPVRACDDAHRRDDDVAGEGGFKKGRQFDQSDVSEETLDSCQAIVGPARCAPSFHGEFVTTPADTHLVRLGWRVPHLEVAIVAGFKRPLGQQRGQFRRRDVRRYLPGPGPAGSRQSASACREGRSDRRSH
jgi:hypothetical protein